MSRNRWVGSLCVAWLSSMLSTGWAVEGTNSPYSDATGDIDPGLSNAYGTLDIVGMEVSNTATDVQFTLTVNGNVSSTDWGKFMIGIATGGSGITSGNGWGRPINLDSPIGGMNYWIGSWVDDGGGAYLYNYNGSSWVSNALGSFSYLSGTNSTLTYTLTTNSLGVSVGDTFYFDAYSSGGGGTDSAIDALSNPNVSVTSWGQTYTSSTTGEGGNGLNSYTLAGTTRVVLYDLYLQNRDGAMVVCWETASEEKTVGFDLYREENGVWVKINSAQIMAQGVDGMGAAYAVADAGANATDTFRYKLVEIETDGGMQEYGPFEETSSNPRMNTLTATPEGMVLRWLSRERDTYEVQRSPNLSQPFESIATGIPATPPVNSYTDPAEKAGSAYYRIRSE